MHPIEKFHKMVTAGNVLSPGGSWVSQSEALQRKKMLIKRIFSGEVENNGQWITLKQLQVDKKNDTPPPYDSNDEVIHLNPGVVSDLQDTSSSITPDAPAAKREPPPFVRQSHPSEAPPPSVQIPPPPEYKAPPNASSEEKTSPNPLASPGPKKGAADTSVSLEEHQTTAEKSEPSGPFQRDTITIRTVSLGKETTLTVSESRAGSALVAVCSVQGFIDQSNADDFNAQLVSMLDFGVRFFIIDLEHTTLVGSAGWGIFAVTARLIKASNGHLLICAMKEEVQESFTLLQFNEVIDSRKTISDCLDVIQTIISEQQSRPFDENEAASIFTKYGETHEDLPLPEKIKTIIAQNGPLSVFKISALLKTERFGKTTINPIKLYLLLKEMNLHTKMSQTRYYRSC